MPMSLQAYIAALTDTDTDTVADPPADCEGLIQAYDAGNLDTPDEIRDRAEALRITQGGLNLLLASDRAFSPEEKRKRVLAKLERAIELFQDGANLIVALAGHVVTPNDVSDDVPDDGQIGEFFKAEPGAVAELVALATAAVAKKASFESAGMNGRKVVVFRPPLNAPSVWEYGTVLEVLAAYAAPETQPPAVKPNPVPTTGSAGRKAALLAVLKGENAPAAGMRDLPSILGLLEPHGQTLADLLANVKTKRIPDDFKSAKDLLELLIANGRTPADVGEALTGLTEAEVDAVFAPPKLKPEPKPAPLPKGDDEGEGAGSACVVAARDDLDEDGEDDGPPKKPSGGKGNGKKGDKVVKPTGPVRHQLPAPIPGASGKTVGPGQWAMILRTLPSGKAATEEYAKDMCDLMPEQLRNLLEANEGAWAVAKAWYPANA